MRVVDPTIPNGLEQEHGRCVCEIETVVRSELERMPKPASRAAKSLMSFSGLAAPARRLGLYPTNSTLRYPVPRNFELPNSSKPNYKRSPQDTPR